MAVSAIPPGLKHKEVVTTREGYVPVYVINDEELDNKFWKSFIPHENFYQLLSKLLDIFEGVKKRRALWLQGGYGTGKSHACGVIKHLLSDDLTKIRDYLEIFEKESLKNRVLGFRQRKRFLTVALKGEENIPKLEYMEFALKEIIRREAKKRFGINLTAETEIDKWIEYLSTKDEKWFQEKFGEISNYATLRDLIEGLKRLDDDAIDEVSTVLSEKEGFVYLPNFKEWVKNALEELKKHGISGIFIIWDEFTGLLQRYEEHATRIQNILAENPDLYLLIVTHRTEEYYTKRLDKETLEKIKSRFESHHYKMEELTTFEILKHVLQKNRQLWEKVVIEFWSSDGIRELERKIADYLNTRKTELRELYPFHPFTAFLITYTVNQFLSANRGILDFLYDPEKGAFQSFLEKEVLKEPFLTVDYLWDFFQKAIEDGQAWAAARSVSTVYRQFESKVREQGEDYLKIFKALLILNLLMKDIDAPIEFLRPTEANLEYAFSGTPLEGKVGAILNWIDESGIVRKDTEGSFVIDERDLPRKEVEAKIAQLKGGRCKNAATAFDGTESACELESSLSSEVWRDVEFLIDTRDKALKSYLTLKTEKAPYKLQVVLGIPTTEAEVLELKREYAELAKLFPNVVFLVVDNFFSSELERFTEYKAKEEVARRFGRVTDAQYFERQAGNILKDIGKAISNSEFYFYFREDKQKLPFSRVSPELQKASKLVFSKGAENLPMVKFKTLWSGGAGPGYLRKILNARDLYDFETSSRGVEKQLLDALRDEEGRYLITEDFRLKEGAKKEHPLVALYDKVVSIFRTKDRVSPKDLYQLKEPPFGVYDKKIYGTLVGTVFRMLKDELFTVGLGKSNTEDLFKFIEGFLKERNREILLRLGDEIERKLISELKDLFAGSLIDGKKLESLNDLNAIRIEARRRIKEDKKWPLWVLEYVISDGELKEAVKELSNFLIKHDSDLTTQERERLLELIASQKIDLKRLLSENEGFERGIRTLIANQVGDDEVIIGKIIKELPRALTNETNFWSKEHVLEKVKEVYRSLIAANEVEERVADNFSQSHIETEPEVAGVPPQTESDLSEFLESLSKEQLIALIKELADKYPEVRSELTVRFGRW